jgi:hypothetical protein
MTLGWLLVCSGANLISFEFSHPNQIQKPQQYLPGRGTVYLGMIFYAWIRYFWIHGWWCSSIKHVWLSIRGEFDVLISTPSLSWVVFWYISRSLRWIHYQDTGLPCSFESPHGSFRVSYKEPYRQTMYSISKFQRWTFIRYLTKAKVPG